jgi:predicted outer membrane protein
MKRSVLSLSAALTAIAALAGCARPPPPRAASVSLTSAATTLPSSATPAPDATAMSDDGAIATVAISIALGQAERARLAESQGVDPRVRTLALRIVESTPAATIQAMDLAPRGSPFQDDVTSATNRDVAALTKKAGTEFDRAFIESEARALANAIELLDQELIPKAVNASLRRELAAMRDELASERREAKYIAVVILPPAPGARE